MATKSIYRSPAGKSEVLELYDKELANLGTETESRMLKTRFGSTHVLVAGAAEAPPVVLLTGVHAGAPRAIEMCMPMTKEFRVYAPDPVGQPGHSAEARPGPRDHNYGLWLVDVLDGLGLDRAAFVGISFGGGILLDLAACAPKRITQAVLVVPAGLADSSFLTLLRKLLLPWMLYRLFPSRQRLVRAIRPFVAEMDESILQFFDTTIRNVKWLAKPPTPPTKLDLEGFTAPVLVLLARDDIFFPVDKAVQRAREILPNLKSVEVFEGPHFATGSARQFINEKLLKFLGGGR